MKEIGRSERQLDKVKEFENSGYTHRLFKAKSIRKHVEKCEIEEKCDILQETVKSGG